ncbi:hypothetical protein HNQ96_005484 [Aminobacter lissarensis]|uniref:Uncharacterized protein n=1 Tax=Aminobacter carboxidus TaxID=376165 RepID=A0A8E1WL05_9HYPH|nr:hypothetical protein [Aminobacter lissarensis]MBB6469594.1 hypothetical protein [Aminobacter lissarensis]
MQSVSPIGSARHSGMAPSIGRWSGDLWAPALEQFQEKCVAVFRPELRKNKKIERLRDSKKSGNALDSHSVVSSLPEDQAISQLLAAPWKKGGCEQRTRRRWALVSFARSIAIPTAGRLVFRAFFQKNALGQ